MVDRGNGNGTWLWIALILAALLIVGHCSMAPGRRKEGYTRSVLGQQNIASFGRTEVDYESLPQANPHYRADPSVKYQPLEHGPVDVWKDERKLSNPGYPMFAQYGNEWRGGWDVLHAPVPTLMNDIHTRFNLRNEGDVSIAKALDAKRPLWRMPDVRQFTNVAAGVNTRQYALPYGFQDFFGD